MWGTESWTACIENVKRKLEKKEGAITEGKILEQGPYLGLTNIPG